MHPDERDGCTDEMEREIGDAEDGRETADALGPALHRLLAEECRERSSETMSAVCRRAASKSTPPKPRTISYTA